MKRKITLKEWRPIIESTQAGAETLIYGVLHTMKVTGDIYERAEAELKAGRLLSVFRNGTMVVLGPKRDSPYAYLFQEDMSDYRGFYAVAR